MRHNRRGTARGIARWRAIAALLLAVPLAAFADSRQDAKRHYRSGMSLIATGQLERGIAELKQAYAIKPHPDVLYNIARAYVDLGDIAEALSYFHRYVATDPKDRAQVEAVMSRLSAATKVPIPAEPLAQPAPPPPPAFDAQKLLADIQEMIARSKAERAVPASSPAPEKKAAIPAKATPAEGKPPAAGSDDMFEPMPITAQTRATAQEIAAALAPHADENIFEEQAVAAAPGRPAADAKGQAPATVIGEAEIRLSGAATVPELLRRLPGIEGIDASTLEIRGFNRRASSKVLLLVDGRSGFQDVFGGIPLVDLPLADVARIEVVRGTGAAFLGSAPYAAVVNVITKNGPEDAAGGRTGGEGATTQGVVAAGAKNAK